MSYFKDEMTETPEDQVVDKILTMPNIITFVRLLMIPAFFVLVVQGSNIAAGIVFGVAAATDFLDGLVARKTHSVSKLGRILDPAVDRCLMIVGVVALLVVGRLPVWIVALVVLRDVYLLVGGAILMRTYHERVPVVFLGKVATTFLFVGWAFLLLDWPQSAGFGIVSVSWLPGFSSGVYDVGIWSVYIGLILALITTGIYTKHGIAARARSLAQKE